MVTRGDHLVSNKWMDRHCSGTGSVCLAYCCDSLLPKNQDKVSVMDLCPTPRSIWAVDFWPAHSNWGCSISGSLVMEVAARWLHTLMTRLATRRSRQAAPRIHVSTPAEKT